MMWDYIVVGAGSAGCALTYELVRAGRTVLLLEAGGSDRSATIKFFPKIRQAMATYDWGYKSQPDPSRNGTSENWVRGRVLGGSSSINGMLYARGFDADYDRWSRLCDGQGGWSSREITSLFRELERSDQKGPSRGRKGPLRTTTVKHPHPIARAFAEAASRSGYPFNKDYNDSSTQGVSYPQRTSHRGLRWSAADAFLRPVLGKGNLNVRMGAVVEKIEMNRRAARAVFFVSEGQPCREEARNVVLCAGAINTPKLLMLSGIGNAADLQALKIEPTHNLPAVGSNLREQPIVRLIYRSKIETYNLTGGWLQKLGFLGKFFTYREGPLSGVYEALGFLKTSQSQPAPDILVYFAPIGNLGKMGGPGGMAPFPAVQACIAKLYPTSTGRIRLASNDPNDPPIIECRLLSERADLDTLVNGVDTVRKIMRAEPIGRLLEAEMVPGPGVSSEQALREYIRDHTEVSMHPLGTCRLGTAADPHAVVDPHLLVRGTDNLWIADASVLPDQVSGNLNAVCIMVGSKLGKHLASRT